MSKNLSACCQTQAGSKWPSSTPGTASAPVAKGEAALGPPEADQTPAPPGTVQYMATLSATAEMSTNVRIMHPVSVCHGGFGMTVLQPLPPSFHAVSSQPRAEADFLSTVPPTATTPAD